MSEEQNFRINEVKNKLEIKEHQSLIERIEKLEQRFNITEERLEKLKTDVLKLILNNQTFEAVLKDILKHWLDNMSGDLEDLEDYKEEQFIYKRLLKQLEGKEWSE